MNVHPTLPAVEVKKKRRVHILTDHIMHHHKEQLLRLVRDEVHGAGLYLIQPRVRGVSIREAVS